MTRVIQSIHEVNLTADISGTLQAPKLSVRSNLDRAVADGVKSVVGTEVAKAEARVRSQVDSIAEVALAPVRDARDGVARRGRSARQGSADAARRRQGAPRVAAQVVGYGSPRTAVVSPQPFAVIQPTGDAAGLTRSDRRSRRRRPEMAPPISRSVYQTCAAPDGR